VLGVNDLISTTCVYVALFRFGGDSSLGYKRGAKGNMLTGGWCAGEGGFAR